MAELNVSGVTSIRFFGLSCCSKTKPAACRPLRGRAKHPCHWEEEEEEEQEEASDGLGGARRGSGPPIVGVWTINLGRLYRTEGAFAIRHSRSHFLAKICLRLVFTRQLVPINMFARISRGSNSIAELRKYMHVHDMMYVYPAYSCIVIAIVLPSG